MSDVARTPKEIYDEYCASPTFREKTFTCIELANGQCAMCGQVAQVAHHKRYPRVLGTETQDDLTALCNRCHHNYHFPPSLNEVRIELHDRAIGAKRGEEVKCPCCEGLYKVYHRTISGAMSLAMKWMADRTCHDHTAWVEMSASAGTPKPVIDSREWSRLKHWSMVELCENDDSKKRTSGLWRLTPKGRAFIAGHIRVPRCIRILNDEIVDSSEETVDINDTWDERFDYGELMNPAMPPLPTS